MVLDAELARFIASPVMIIIGTRDKHNRAAIARGAGATVLKGSGMVEVIVSEWQWPDCIANIHATGHIAATFVRPSDYVAYQLKGRGTVRTAAEEDIRLSRRYVVDIVDTLGGLGVEPQLAAPWIVNAEAAVIRLAVEDVYLQTPGPGAGALLRGVA
ncbi:hypothetical protein [Rhizobium sp. LjRoot258]|uniref:hypothetical protein n=1 Tax=Rhizobium sp. LjRoot258 TaxID=3342299 RepID=UPI003ECFD98E